MDSTKFTEKLMTKLKSLKLLDNLEEHVQESLGIILEETLDHNLSKLKPRATILKPTIKFDRCEIIVKGGPPNGRKSRYKFHLMSVGDVMIVDEKYELAVHQGFNHFIKTHKPNWGFEKTKDERNREIKFKRIK